MLIANQLQRIDEDFSLSACAASEIEFYLPGAERADIAAFWQEVSNQCANGSIALYKTDKEDGKEQFEVALKPAAPIKTAADTTTLKAIIAAAALNHQMTADFSAKPFADQPGSGLHIHLHLADKQGKNVFYKDDYEISPALRYSLGGLIAWLNPCMAIFAPHVESYKRFQAHSNGPRTVSWGANNRTVAIRLPDSEHDNKRIEHRVSGSDADPELVIAAILAGVYYGLKNSCDPGPQIFGDAALPMYKLPLITTTLEEAVEQMRNTPFIEDYFSVSSLLPAL